MARTYAWLAALATTAVGCNTTGLVVVVTSDLAVPSQLDRVELTVVGPSGRTQTATASLTGAHARALPLTLYLDRGSSAQGPVTVTATGYDGASVVVAQTARTTFDPGSERTLVIALDSACVGVTCRSDQTCVASICAAPDVVSSTLPRWTGSPPTSDGGTCASTPARDTCQSIPPLPAEPTIDGVLDCGATLATLPVNGWTGSAAGPATASARYVVAWRPDGLYVFVDVTDPTRNPAPTSQEPECGDAVEFEVDSDGAFDHPTRFDDPGTRHFIVAAPGDDATPSTRAIDYADPAAAMPWTSSRFVATPRAGGYTVEAFVQASDLGLSTWSPTAMQHIGLDVAVDVDNQGAPVAGCNGYDQWVLRVAPDPPSSCVGGRPFCDTDAFCTPVLASR